MAQRTEDKYEYEYDPTEVETFLVDLDIASLNGVIKSRTPGTTRSLQRPLPKGEATRPTQPSNAEDELDRGEGEANTRTAVDPASKRPSESRKPVVGTDIQILDLHTHNPIISYQDHIYSCTWSDVVGTSMFFSQHERTPIFDPEASTEDYDLLGTSRIKLIGHKAKVTQKPGTRKRGRPSNDDREGAFINEDEILTTGKSLGNLRYNNAKVNADIKRQARFLERFIDAKRAKGEKDNVRTVVTRQTAIGINKARKESQGQSDKVVLHDEIERLNRRVLRGDTEALVRLQQIYSLLEDDGEDLPQLPSGIPIAPQGRNSNTSPDPSTPTPSELQNTAG